MSGSSVHHKMIHSAQDSTNFWHTQSRYTLSVSDTSHEIYLWIIWEIFSCSEISGV